MKNKIITFLCIIALLILGAIGKLIPIKADTIENNEITFPYNTYYVFGLDIIDAQAIGQENQWQIASVYMPNSSQFGDVSLNVYLIWGGSNSYTVDFSIYDTDGHLVDSYTYEVSSYTQGDAREHFITIYNQYYGPSNYMYISVCDVSTNVNNFIDTITLPNTYYMNYTGQAVIKLAKYNYLFNDYCDTSDGNTVQEVLNILKNRINYFYDNSPYKGKLHAVYNYGVNIGQATPITRDWIATVFDKVTTFLNIQILPNLTFGTLLAIPLVLGILRLVLFIWRRN